MLPFGPGIGDFLLTSASSAQDEVLLVAPFIKENAFREILRRVDSRVKITCVTRWRVPEILIGVSDLDIWKALCERGGCLLIKNDLHAKYYRFDDIALIGSANISNAALGWSNTPNLEILCPPNDQDSLRQQFENELLRTSVPATKELYDSLKELVEQTDALEIPFLPQSGELETSAGSQNLDETIWVPTLRQPAELYTFYAGLQDQVSAGLAESAQNDLKAFDLPRGLNQAAFEMEIGLQLLAKSIIQKIDAFLSQPRRFGEVRRYLQRVCPGSLELDDASRLWQVLMRWMLQFLPFRYRLKVPSHSEIIYRVE